MVVYNTTADIQGLASSEKAEELLTGEGRGGKRSKG